MPRRVLSQWSDGAVKECVSLRVSDSETVRDIKVSICICVSLTTLNLCVYVYSMDMGGFVYVRGKVSSMLITYQCI